MQEMGPFTSLSEKTKISYHLQMSQQRQHVLLSYFKTLSVGPVLGLNPRPSARQSGALQHEGPYDSITAKTTGDIFSSGSVLRMSRLLVGSSQRLCHYGYQILPLYPKRVSVILVIQINYHGCTLVAKTLLAHLNS